MSFPDDMAGSLARSRANLWLAAAIVGQPGAEHSVARIGWQAGVPTADVGHPRPSAGRRTTGCRASRQSAPVRILAAEDRLYYTVVARLIAEGASGLIRVVVWVGFWRSRIEVCLTL
jgi:hypothetical protein